MDNDLTSLIFSIFAVFALTKMIGKRQLSQMTFFEYTVGVGAHTGESNQLHVTSATIGRVVDMGITDPFNMGAAMAPAAFHTIEAHFRDRQLPPDTYDLIVTGDLGRVGHSILCELFEKHRIG